MGPKTKAVYFLCSLLYSLHRRMTYLNLSCRFSCSELFYALFQILCIDEATANVDEDTDQLIQRTLRTAFRKSTVFTIAHRIRTIFDSDRVLVLENGTVIEFDSPENLRSDANSQFYKLVHIES